MLGVLLVLPGSAAAAQVGTVSRLDGALVYRASAPAQLTIADSVDGTAVVFSDTGGEIAADDPDCVVTGGIATCPKLGLSAIRAYLSGAADTATVTEDDGALTRTVFGGPGSDTLTGGAGDDHLAGGDGAAADHDTLVGNEGADTLVAAGRGADTVQGDAGDDVISTNAVSSTVNDVSCGDGADTWEADYYDAATVADCESRVAGQYRAVVTLSGAGAIWSDDRGADCSPTACNLDRGTDAHLHALPPAGLRFSGWGGGCQGPLRRFTLTAVQSAQTCSAQTVAFDTLLANPGAEDGDADATTVPGWTTTPGYTQHRYGDADFPDAAATGAIHGEDQFFFAGAVDSGTATQTVDVAASAASIDAGRGRVHLSADLGGYAGQADSATVTATFLGTAGPLGTPLTVGPVTVGDRNGQTGLQPRDAVAYAPAGTRSIRVAITATRVDGSDNDGYADDVGLTLADADPAPDVRTGQPTFVTPYQLWLNGDWTVRTAGSATEWFDYGTTPGYGYRTDSRQGSYAAGDTPALSLRVHDLVPGTTFHYRHVVQDASGVNYGPDVAVTLPQPNARTSCTDTMTRGATSFAYTLCGVPDLDQVRHYQLPGDGYNFCAPTSTTDFMAYLSARGEDLRPDPLDFTLPANFAAGSSAIWTMGTGMGTTASGGTHDLGFLTGLHGWLAKGQAGDTLTTARFEGGKAGIVSVPELRDAALAQELVIPVLGFYSPDASGTYQRVGGHVVAMVGLSGPNSGLSGEIVINDPYSVAVDDDVQTPYAAERFQLGRFTGPIGDGTDTTLPQLLDYGYQADGLVTLIDEFFTIAPARVAVSTGHGGFGLATPHWPVPGSRVPVQERVRVSGPDVTDVALPAGGDRAAVLQQGSDRVRGVDLVTHRVSTLATVAGAHALAAGGARLFVAGSRGITALAADGHVLATAKLAGAAHATIAFDAAHGQLAALVPGQASVHLYSAGLKSAGRATVPGAALRGSGAAQLAVGAAGQLLVHRDGAGVLAVSGGASRSTPGRPHFATRTLSKARRTRGLAVTPGGNLLVSEKGRLVELTLAGKRLKGSRFTGLEGGPVLAITQSSPLAPEGADRAIDTALP